MQVFRSERSTVLMVIIALSMAVGPILALTAAPPSQRTQVATVMTLVLVPVVAFLVWLYRTTDYRVEGTRLVVRSGPFAWRVELASVRRIRATNSVLSAPALSLNRIEIQYGNHGTIMVSPEDRRGFVRAIVAQAPHAVVEGLESDR